jgi:hypothetical protein
MTEGAFKINKKGSIIKYDAFKIAKSLKRDIIARILKDNSVFVDSVLCTLFACDIPTSCIHLN